MAGKKGKRHRIRRILVTLLIAFCLLGGALTLLVGGYVQKNFATGFPEELLVAGRGGITPRFFLYDFTDRSARVGTRREVTRELYPQRAQIYVTEDSLPQHLKDAFVAIEDKRFYSHRGVDWYRTVAASANCVLGFSDSFGASTITQQLVKNLTGRREVRFSRKLQEILWALDLERSLTKGEILELYLNVIHFADRCEGIGAAAMHYFGKRVEELSVAESACLAAVINNPTEYHPLRRSERNRERRELILAVMRAEGFLEEAEYRAAISEELHFIDEAVEEGINSWYVDMVTEDIIEALCRERGMTKSEASRYYFGGGLSVDLAMDSAVQETVESYYAHLNTLPTNAAGEAAESAVIVIDPRTGDVLGVAGGVGEKSGNRLQNFATATLRPPGSALKPITVYAPALSRGIIHWGSVYDDVPVNFGSSGTRPWPRNADGVYRGLCNIAYAVAHSTNTVAVRVLEEVGLEESFAFARDRFHLSSLRADREANDCDVAALALGQLNYGVTLRELTAAYSVFADGGVYHPWRSYYRVTDAEGRVILSSPDSAEEVLSAENAAIMTKLLEGVVREGTSSSISLGRRIECAGKTGTTSHDYDRWFVGYTPDLICGVWCGYAYPSPLSGRNLCTGIWNDVMTALWQKRGGNAHFSIPGGVFQASFCLDSGELLGDHCLLDARGSRRAVGWFTGENCPLQACTRHVLCDYDVDGEGLSHGACPSESIRSVAFVRVLRDFPVEVTVSDAPYTVWEDPKTLPPNENSTVAYNATDRRRHRGVGRGGTPHNRSCPFHRPEVSEEE